MSLRLTIFACACALGALSPAAASASELLVVGDEGIRVADDPHLPPPEQTDLPTSPDGDCSPDALRPDPVPVVPHAAATVRGALTKARRQRRITAAEYDRYRDIYSNALSTRRRLGGRNQRELSAVIETLERIARAGRLSSGRMAALFLQLGRNREFWARGPTFPPRTDIPREPSCGGRSRVAQSGNGSRVSFDGSPLIYQYYAGSGLQIQPLANFGKLNALYTSCRRAASNPARYTCELGLLRQLADELVAIRSKRGSFTTWEYYFPFGGGSPPWTSGLSQGTAIQSLARAYLLVRDRTYLRVARGAIGAFQTRYPVGVRAPGAGGGNHYLIYSFSPGLRVLNGFIQALTGLWDYHDVTKDRRARRLFNAGDRSARREMPLYDTGGWSLYSARGAESTLGYHKLVRGFLRNLCQRTKKRHYCYRYNRFLDYEKTAPRIRMLRPRGARARRPVTIRFRLDRVACVTVRVRREGRKVFSRQLKLFRGTRAVTFTPRRSGVHEVEFDSVNLNDVRGVKTDSFRVR